MVPGGWYVHESVSEEDRKIFEDALNLLGVDYEPLIAATQVVNGIKYLFIAKYKTVTLEPVIGIAKVTFIVNHEGISKPIIEKII